MKRFTPQLESLEARTLMAGNITADLIGGDLVINGDDASNSVIVYRTGTGDWVVAGGYSYGAATTVNQSTSPQVFWGELYGDDVRINLKDGHDKLQMYNAGNYFAPTVADDLVIIMGNGHDDVILHDLWVDDDVIINTGAGSDEVFIEDFWAFSMNNSQDGSMFIDTGLSSSFYDEVTFAGTVWVNNDIDILWAEDFDNNSTNSNNAGGDLEVIEEPWR